MAGFVGGPASRGGPWPRDCRGPASCCLYPSDVRSLAWLRQFAYLLDSRFRIPGTQVRFGLDPVLSLVPGLGDLVSPAFAVALLVQGIHQGVPKIILLRMLLNGLVDAVVGIVPIAGTVGDIFFRANSRNLALLERHARPGVQPTRGDYVFVLAAAGLFGMVVLVPVVLGIWLAVYVLGRVGF